MELISREQNYSGKNSDLKLFGIKWNISREYPVFHKANFVVFHNTLPCSDKLKKTAYPPRANHRHLMCYGRAANSSRVL